MVTGEQIVKCAGSIVTGMNLGRMRRWLFVGTHTQKLLEEIGILCYKRGATFDHSHHG